MYFKPLFTEQDLLDADIDIATQVAFENFELDLLGEEIVSSGDTTVNVSSPDDINIVVNDQDLEDTSYGSLDGFEDSSGRKQVSDPSPEYLAVTEIPSLKIDPKVEIAEKNIGWFITFLSLCGISSPIKRARLHNKIAHAIGILTDMSIYRPQIDSSDGLQHMIRHHHNSLTNGDMSIDEMLIALGSLNAIITLKKSE